MRATCRSRLNHTVGSGWGGGSQLQQLRQLGSAGFQQQQIGDDPTNSVCGRLRKFDRSANGMHRGGADNHHKQVWGLDDLIRYASGIAGMPESRPRSGGTPIVGAACFWHGGSECEQGERLGACKPWPGAWLPRVWSAQACAVKKWGAACAAVSNNKAPCIIASIPRRAQRAQRSAKPHHAQHHRPTLHGVHSVHNTMPGNTVQCTAASTSKREHIMTPSITVSCAAASFSQSA